MTGKLRVAVVGTGSWAQRAHIPGWQRDPRAEVVALADAGILCWESKYRYKLWRPVTAIRAGTLDKVVLARELLVEVLTMCGAIVSCAASVAEAMDRIQETKPDILLSDIGMPGEDGFELIRRVRALPPEAGGGMPAAALTAFARPEDRRKALDAGFMMHVPKPVEPEELIAVIAKLTGFAVPR